jgi:hypothetical protein
MTHSARSNLLGTIVRTDHVPSAAIGELPAWRSGRITQAGLSCDVQACWLGGSRPAVVTANPEVCDSRPRENALMSFKEFMGRKGEETFQSPLLTGSFTRSMTRSRVELENQTVSFI